MPPISRILPPARVAYLRDVGAILTGRYGSKGLELLLLMVATRVLDTAAVGVVFLAQAAGALSFKLLDFGLYPVLMRRASRDEADRRTLRWTSAFRATGAAAITLVFGAIAAWRVPDRAAFATGFFLIGGAQAVHEVSRAVVAGRSRFLWAAKANVAAKGTEVAIAVAGLLNGAGLIAWLVGRALGQGGLLLVMYVAALRELPPTAAPSPAPRALLREGLPFWFSRSLNMGIGRLDTVLVTAWFGFTGAAHVGIAHKVVGAGLGLVGAMTHVAFPALARERRRFVTSAQAATVTTSAVLLGGGVFLLAPLLVRIVMGTVEPTVVALVRILAPAISLAAITRPLHTWLEAKGKERSVALISVLNATVALSALLVLLPTVGILGAAWAALTRNAAELLLTGLLILVALRRVRSPWVWLLARIPALDRRFRRGAAETAARMGRQLGQLAGVAHVSVVGSANEPDRFVPGQSDVDFLVGATSTEAVDGVQRQTRTLLRRQRTPGKGEAQVLEDELIGWLRLLGDPIRAPIFARTAAGHPPHPEPLARHFVAWGLQHAAMNHVRMQQTALQHSRADGAVRAGAFLKLFRYGWLEAARAPNASASLEPFEARGMRPLALAHERSLSDGWLAPDEVGMLLATSQRRLHDAFEHVGRHWAPPSDATPAGQPPTWLRETAHTIAPRIDWLQARIGPVPMELTPTGPTRADPMWIVAPDGWGHPDGIECWVAWLDALAGGPGLHRPFRAYRWPVIMPPGVLRADACAEHPPLFHAARRQGAITLHEGVPLAKGPPAEELRAGALRSTVHAVFRIPQEITHLARAPLADRPRARDMLDARLAALTLWLDHGNAPSDPDSVAEAYAARHDDPLAQFMLLPPSERSETAACAALAHWRAERMERLRT
ncbi:MAG: lipopolysaccharide biosynthesis protein, partial [Myxococcota bacterium]